MRNAFQAPALLILSVTFALAQTPQPPDRVYRSLNDPATPSARRIELAEAFLASRDPAFINAADRDNVYLALLQAYLKEKDWLKMLNTVDRMDQLAPKTPRDRKLQILTEAMTVAANDVRDPVRLIAYAQRIVAVDPENINALRALATVVPQGQVAASAPRLMEYSRKILALRKPERMSDDEWKKLRAEVQEQTHLLVFSNLITNRDTAGCVAAFEDLVKIVPKDAAAQFRLGICYLNRTGAAVEQLNAANLELTAFINECNGNRSCAFPEGFARRVGIEEKQALRIKEYEDLRDNAIEALAISVAVGGVGTERAARTELERAYRAKYAYKQDPLEGLDGLIALKKKEIADK